MYHVIFRACDKVNAVNGIGRPTGIHKTPLVKACFQSLLTALEGFPHRITVLGDKLSDDLADFFRRHRVELVEGSYGNDESIRQTLMVALAAGSDDWVYFCEDDYLHQPNTFSAIDELIRNRNRYLAKSSSNWFDRFHYANSEDLIIFPADYPDRYQARYRAPTRIYLSATHHWRQVYNITFTFLAHASTVRKYAWAIQHCSNGAKDTRLGKIMLKGLGPHRPALCLSPLPGLTAHMHEGTMSPLMDWTQLLKRMQHVG